MIPFEFAYHRPATLKEAMALKQRLDSEKQNALWYAGGTEIISMARVGSIRPRAVIDVKALPEMRALSQAEGLIRLGAAFTLTQVAESGLFPLLSQTVSRIADHTNQCKITLGGNLAGTIHYREAALPLLLADAKAQVAMGQKVETLPLVQLFDGALRLPPAGLLLSAELPARAASWPFVHFKCVRGDKIDYPLFTLAAAKDDAGLLRAGFSGLCAAPFRHAPLEKALNDRSNPPEKRAEAALTRLPSPVLEDGLGSGAYRLFRAKLALEDAISALEGSV